MTKPRTSHGWKNSMSRPIDEPAPRTTATGARVWGTTPTMAIAASVKDANVTAVNASPIDRKTAVEAWARDKTHDRSSVNGHVGPSAVAGGGGAR